VTYTRIEIYTIMQVKCPSLDIIGAKVNQPLSALAECLNETLGSSEV
jgi:hypothetical protein